MSEWYPIETAPAGQVLVSDGINTTIAYRLIHQGNLYGWWHAAPYSRKLIWQPVYWMDLPIPPSRDQVADLILTSPEGNRMVICSPFVNDHGAQLFDVRDTDTGREFTVKVKITER